MWGEIIIRIIIMEEGRRRGGGEKMQEVGVEPTIPSEQILSLSP